MANFTGTRKRLRALQHDWNGHGAPKLAEGAIEAACSAAFVPTAHGGVAVEWHVAGLDIEIEFEPGGKVNVMVGQA